MLLARVMSLKTDPVVTPPDTTLEEISFYYKPAAGFVTVAVRIPAGSICQGLVAVGTNGTTEWDGLLQGILILLLK